MRVRARARARARIRVDLILELLELIASARVGLQKRGNLIALQ